MAARISLTREQYLDSIRQLTASATTLAARFNMNQLTWQPEAGERWNILECLDHIAISTAVYLDAMQTAIGSARPGKSADVFHTAGLPSTMFTLSQEPPPRRKFPAPGKISPHPAEPGRYSAGIREDYGAPHIRSHIFRRQRSEFRSFPESADPSGSFYSFQRLADRRRACKASHLAG